MIRSRLSLLALLCACFVSSATDVFAQDEAADEGPLEGLPTIISIRAGSGWGMGRSRQLYGYNGTTPVYWSTGEGVKMNLALDLPLLPVEVVDSFDVDGPGRTPVVALELEAGTGYNISTGGTTIESVFGGFQTTTRRTTYVPVLLGLNTRATFGAGLPSVYIGAGGGVYLVGIYEEDVLRTASGDVSAQSSSQSFTRKMNPPLPFALYGALGVEFPLAYSPDDGNSLIDLYGEMRLTEMSAYVYDYTVRDNAGGPVQTVNAEMDPTLRYATQQRSASNVALTLGFKINIY